MDSSIKQHWENVYKTKTPDQVSWTQTIPRTSLEFIHSFNVAKDAKIIDIGGGDSKLVDYLLIEGYQDITVLDISSKALDKAKERLGKLADQVKWVVSDITEFNPDASYDVWHDRATFHFLTSKEQVDAYLSIASNVVKGYMTIGTFSTSGPLKCSGLDITQYSEETLTKVISDSFDKMKCINEDHKTPFNTIQNFLFCSFKKKN